MMLCDEESCVRKGWLESVTVAAIVLVALVGAGISMGPEADAGDSPRPGNAEASQEEFTDRGFGLFIHWGPVAQIGKEIGWPVADASQDFRDKYFNLYKTFNPNEFNPERWARLARGAGMKYVVFTTKHHAGFCMYDSAYTDYDIMNTPYGQDLTAQVAEAFRAEDIAIGWYYSPADWHYLYVTGHESSYHYGMKPGSGAAPYGTKNLPLLEYEKKQIRELLTNYGHIDIMWYDGPGKKLAAHTWKLQPDVFVARARGAGIPTPEQTIPQPGKAPDSPWETCMTMGRQWAYKPNDHYKSVQQLVHKLVKIRAMGGNYLLNVGPKADGTLPEPQVNILKGLAEWMDVNAEAIHGVRSWKKAHEGKTWFTWKKDGRALYAILLQWPESREVTIESLKGAPVKSVRLLGSGDELEWAKGKHGLITQIPTDKKPCKHAFTLKVKLGSSEAP